MFTVLYTDDEPGLLELGKIFLETSGTFTVETAISAQEALTLLKSRPFDCIVSDYQMPEKDGIALLKELRSDNNQIPFILFTGRGREEIAIEALNNGADYYLQKGGDPAAQFAELSHKIRLAVGSRRTIQALLESEAKYRRILENLQDAYVRVDVNGIVTMVNPSAVRMYGYGSAQEMTGIPAMSLYSGGKEQRTDTLVKLREAGGITDFSGEGLRKDGTTFPVSMNLQFVRDEAGRPAGTEAIVRDISDRMKAQDELRAAYEQIAASEEELRGQYEELARGEREIRESRERLIGFMDSATDAFTIWDAGLNLVDLNRAALVYLRPGEQKEDVIGKNYAEFISGGDEWGSIDRYREVIRTGVPFSGTGKRLDPRFGRHWLNVRCFRVGDGFGIVTSDITREKEVEEELRRCEKKFRHIIENMQDAYLHVDEKGIITLVNRAAARMYGYRSAEEMAGLPATALYPGQKDRAESLRILQDSGGLSNFSLETVRKDGTTFPVSVSVQVITDEDGRVTGTEAIVRDMSEKR